MPNIKFPTDLDRIQTTDDAVVLAADANGVSHNMQVGEMIEHIKEQVPLEELTATVSSQQQTIEQQRNALDLLNAVNSLNSDSLDHLQQLLVENGEALDQAIDNETRLTNLANALQATQAAPALEAEVTEGKGKLAKAIRMKGIEANSSETLSTLAKKVEDITQETVQFDLRSYYNNYVWGLGCYNLLEVAAEIKTKYINTGQFKGAIVQDIYYIEPTTDLTNRFTLSGVFAVVTSDGDMYANDGVHTPFGVHTWHDEDSGYLNRWVAFLFATDEYTFLKQSTSTAYNRSHLVVVGHCKEIGVDYNYFMQIFIPEELGQLDNFRYLGTNNVGGFYDPVLVFDNMLGHATGEMFRDSGRIMMLCFLKMRSYSGGNMFYGGTYSSLSTISFPALQTVSGGTMFNGTYSALSQVSFPALQTVSGGYMFYNSTFGSLSTLSFPALQTVSGGYMFYGCTFGALSTLSFPALQTVSGGNMFYGGTYSALQSIEMPMLEEIRGNSGKEASAVRFAVVDNLYLPSLKYFSSTSVNQPPMVNAKVGVYIPQATRGYLTYEGTSGYSGGVYTYLLLGAKGEPNEVLGLYTALGTSKLQVLEIGDKEYIDAGLEPRWQPRQPIRLVGGASGNLFSYLTTESMAVKLLDRLADNTDGEPITITLGTSNLNRLLADETYAPYVAVAQAKNYTIV